MSAFQAHIAQKNSQLHQDALSRGFGVSEPQSMIVIGSLSAQLIDALNGTYSLTFIHDCNPAGTIIENSANAKQLRNAAYYLYDRRGKIVDWPTCFDAAICRGMVLFLIDDQSQLAESFDTNRHPCELISEADIAGDLIALRCAAKQQAASHAVATSSAVDKVVNENALTILQSIMEQSTDWMVVKDIHNRFVMASDRFFETAQRKKEEVIGKNDLEIGTPEEIVLGDNSGNSPGFWNEDRTVIESGLATSNEQVLIHETSLEQVRERVTRVPLKDAKGDVFGLLICVTQVSQSKLNGNIVTSTSSRRMTEMQPIVKRLKDDRNKAELLSQQTLSAFKSKNNFIATASHDLRQPLHALGLFIESLDRQLENEQQRRTLAKMRKSSQHLNELLNSILDISKLDAGAVSVTKSHFSILPLLKSIEDEFTGAANENSLRFNVGKSDFVVHTDSLLLSRILKNLVSNAVKYTASGSVNIMTEILQDSLVIRVKDTGPGIPEEQYQTVFNEYHQIKNQDSVPNFGFGLGLSIVKRLVELLDLKIQLESKLGEGSEFSVYLPLGDDSLLASVNDDDQLPATASAHKLLVIEDDPIVLDAMTNMLQGFNCDVYPAYNIEESVEIIKELEELPDAMIVDYQLADGVTGNQAIAAVNSAAQTSIPAIVVTGNTHSSIVRRAGESAFRVLNKPVSPDTLIKTINSAVESFRTSVVLEND